MYKSAVSESAAPDQAGGARAAPAGFERAEHTDAPIIDLRRQSARPTQAYPIARQRVAPRG
jgi:hypothetical protein